MILLVIQHRPLHLCLYNEAASTGIDATDCLCGCDHVKMEIDDSQIGLRRAAQLSNGQEVKRPTHNTPWPSSTDLGLSQQENCSETTKFVSTLGGQSSSVDSQSGMVAENQNAVVSKDALSPALTIRPNMIGDEVTTPQVLDRWLSDGAFEMRQEEGAKAPRVHLHFASSRTGYPAGRICENSSQPTEADIVSCLLGLGITQNAVDEARPHAYDAFVRVGRSIVDKAVSFGFALTQPDGYFYVAMTKAVDGDEKQRQSKTISARQFVATGKPFEPTERYCINTYNHYPENPDDWGKKRTIQTFTSPVTLCDFGVEKKPEPARGLRKYGVDANGQPTVTRFQVYIGICGGSGVCSQTYPGLLHKKWNL